MRLAHANDIRVRLGFLNASGEQKGVDSLIVTDIVELARNRAVADVVLMSGDEDVRIGVQLAQSFGVRVHLLGIKPCAGTQSTQLRQEADTCSEWDVSIVSKIISLRPTHAANPTATTRSDAASAVATIAQVALNKATANASLRSNEAADPATLNDVIEQLLGELTPAEVKGAANYMLANRNNVPHELDGKLLARCRTAIGKNLDDASRRYVRSRVRQRIRDAAAA
jgi:hypothetical protein